MRKQSVDTTLIYRRYWIQTELAELLIDAIESG